MADFDPNSINIEELVNDRAKFNAFVYTPVEEAVRELKRRSKDKGLGKKVNDLLGGDIPQPFLDGPRGVLFRQLVTPNYEVRRFVSIIDAIEYLKPCFWEYHGDKFTSNNEWKHSLGKMMFYKGKGKKGGVIIDRLNVIDFNKSNGKKISDVETLWHQSIVDFHHTLFGETYFFEEKMFFDATVWFQKHGNTANNYYLTFLPLFMIHGILFENFALEKELSFTKEIFLPAFIEVTKKIGQKPLIVALEPTEIEGEDFWNAHPHTSKKFVEKKLNI